VRPHGARLTLTEQVAWLRIVQAETHAGPRRLLARWAQPGDLHPCARRLLDETLRRMWRTRTGE
jgi:hypothetical protein